MISVTGIREIDRVLKGLPVQLQDRVLKNAHADAAKPLVATAKNIVPVGKTRNLQTSIGVERASLKTTNAVGLVYVKPRIKAGFKGFHAALVEFGSKERRTKTTNANRGRMPKQPFLWPAFNQTKGQVESNIATSLGRKLNQFMKRTIKNG